MTATAAVAMEEHILDDGVLLKMVFVRQIARLAFITAAFCVSHTVASQEAAVSEPATPVAPVANDGQNILYLDLSTGGRVTIQLYPDAAPTHVERIKTLARRGFYDGIIFHRVIDGFMAQTGDPTGTGQGDSDLPDLKAEFNKSPHLRGTVSMARTNDPDSANSQFFICFLPRFSLDNKYTVFGRVTGGMQYVDAIARGEPPVNPDRIVHASIGADPAALPPVTQPVPGAANGPIMETPAAPIG